MARPKKGPMSEADQKARFLAALEQSGNVTAAADEARLPRKTAYNWRAADDGFAAAWDAALSLGVDGLEDEATRRAHDGTLKPVYQGGRRVGTVREYSDTLLIFLLKARRPERFKERVSAEVSGPGGGPVQVQVYIPDNGRDDPTP